MAGIVGLGLMEAAVPADVEVLSTAGADLASADLSGKFNACLTVKAGSHKQIASLNPSPS